MEIIDRERWNAWPYRGQRSPLGPVRRVVVHHSAGTEPEDAEGAASVIRGIQHYHQTERGYSDVAYHYVVGAGYVFEGRARFDAARLALGAHTGGRNTGSVGICVLGNFDVAVPDARDVQALTRLVEWLCACYGLTPDVVQGHRDHGQTACPGAHLYAVLPAIRRQVAA